MPEGNALDDIRTRRQLKALVKEWTGLTVPDKPVCPHHNAPLDYLVGSLIDQRDLLVWANRGGGKTMLAAVATVLDAVYRAPAKICVLGGSFDQSDRLADYIREILDGHEDVLDGPMRRDRVRIAGGSEIRMLAQSQRAVRGQHVQKIRCDEVDLFDDEVWRAVQFSVKSQGKTRGSLEVLSTLHRVGGLMERLTEAAERYRPRLPAGGKAKRRRGGSPVPTPGFEMVQWCLWEVIERCPPGRKCSGCPLEEDCGGLARKAQGFFPIEDAIGIKARSSRAAWESEMLCRGARRQWLVFGEFDPAVHVGAVEYQPGWPMYRAIDFGYRSPLVCLWVQVSPGGAVHVIDEYVQTQRPLAQHAEAIKRKDPGEARATYVDPAGRQRESTSGSACVEMLDAEGFRCICRSSTIAEGLELIRTALAPATGEPTLRIAPHCRSLIRSMRTYHYPAPGKGDPDRPVKDGPDHCVDALRYFFVNRCRPRVAAGRKRY
jgi:hypothetical protein